VLIMGLLLAAAVVASAAPGAIVTTPGYDSNTLTIGDDDWSGPFDLGFSVDFLGDTFSQAYIGSNGYLSFGNGSSTIPWSGAADVALNSGASILMPYGTDLNPGLDGTMTAGQTAWNGRDAFAATWHQVPLFGEGTPHSDHSFQVYMIDRSVLGAGFFDFMFNYDVLDVSLDYLTYVGWARSDGSSAYDWPGSGVPSQFNDGQPLSLTAGSTNGVAGRYYFTSRSGVIGTDTVAPTDPTLSSSTATATPSNDPTITVDLSGATDGTGSGVDGFGYSWTQNATETPDAVKDLEQTASAVTTSVADGTWWFNLRTVDAAGNWTNTAHLGPFVIDTTSPTDPTTLWSPSHTPGTWSPNPTVNAFWSADATDTGGSGVDGFSVSWSMDDTETPDAVKDMEESTTATFTALPDGWWWFNLRTVDNAGNWTSTEHLGPFGIDTTPPTTTDDATALYLAPANITLTATDTAGSGVDYTRWRLDGGMLTTGTVVTTDTIGVHQLDYFSVDMVGNQETTNTVFFEVVPDPYAVDDEYWVNEDGLLVAGGMGVMTNDLFTGWPMMASVIVDPAHGEVVMDTLSGSFMYQPDPDFFGTDSFDYLLTDMSDSSTATVTINVMPMPDEPVIGQGASEEATTAEDTPVGIPLSASDPDTSPLTWSIADQPDDGVATASGTGTSTVVTYTPDPDFNGDDAFTAKVEDGEGNTALVLVTVHVTPVNDAPVAMDDNYTTPEDTVLNVPAPGILGNDTDVDGDPLNVDFGTLGVTQLGPMDSITFGPDGWIQYTPSPDATGTTVITYGASDGTTTSVLASLSITVTDVNDPPTAIDPDSAFVDENLPAGSHVCTLTATDIDSVPSDFFGPGSEPFEVVGDELLTTEPLDFEAQASYVLTITVDDGDGGTYSEPLTVNVNDVNEPPVAVDDEYTVAEDNILVVDLPPGPPDNLLLDNDSDPEGDAIAWMEGMPAVPFLTANGTVFPIVGGAGEFFYLPDPDFNGSDTFTYHVYETATPDGFISNTATVTITVTPVNDPPVAADDYYAVDEDDVLFANSVLNNDSDPVEADPIMAGLQTLPAHGDLVFNEPAGTFIYVPEDDYFGLDWFTYACSDGLDSDVATAYISVDPVYDDPVILQGSSVSTSTPEDTTKLVSLEATDTDGDPLTWSLGSDPEHGAATVATGPAGSTTVTYTPDPDYNGLDSFEVIVSDGMGGTDVVLISVTVTPVNDPPVAMPDMYVVPEDTTITVPAPGVLDNDYDVDMDVMWWMPGAAPLNGNWWPISPDGAFAYRGDPDWNGTDYFTYHTEDVGPWSSSAMTTVTIVVTPVNDPPHDLDLSDSDVDENLPAGSVVGTVTPYDIDSTEFTYSLEPTSAPFEMAGNELRTAMPLNYEMQASYGVTITVDDGDGGLYSEPATITVNDVNDVPVAMDDSFVTSEDTTLVVAAPGFMANDSDEDSDTLTAVLGAGPYNGSLVASLTSGGITYTPDPNWFGIDSFEYAVSDGTTRSTTVTVSIEVLSVNDVPVGTEDGYAMKEDTVLTVVSPGVLDNDFDVEGPMMSVLETDVANGTLDLADDGSFVYEPGDGWSGTDMFWYRVSDGTTMSAPVTVTVSVGSVDTDYESVAGANRIITAIQASKKAFPGGADTIVVSTGYNWPDALGGSALAGVVDGPVLLTATDALPSNVLAEVRRLGAKDAIILGGTDAVSRDVGRALEAELGAGHIRRLGGATRYETAVLVARDVISRQGAAFDGKAFAATGTSYPDALSASPLAAANGWPIYLVQPGSSVTGLRSEMQARGVEELVVLGGKANVSLAAQATLGAGTIGTSRVSGSDRYSTCAAVATFGVEQAGLGWDGVAIATGDLFPDALAGGVFAAKRGTVLLLTPSDSLHSATAATLSAHRSEIESVAYLGGPAAINQSVRDDITGLLR
jgi:putative cell wall-binding protein